MALENNNLERKIKEALENLAPEYDPTSWDILEQRLSTEDTLNSSDDSSIDDLVVSSLAGLSVAGSADWSLFEDKLEASEVSELEEIDQLAYQSLSRFEVPYEPSHWGLMLKRIEAELTLRGKLYRYKVGEVVLMLLLIFTFINLQPLDHFPIKIGSDKENIEKVSDEKSFNGSTQNKYLIPQGDKVKTGNDLKQVSGRPIASNISTPSNNEKRGVQTISKKEELTSKAQIKEDGVLIEKNKIDRSLVNTPNQLPKVSSLIQSNKSGLLANNNTQNIAKEEELPMIPMINSLVVLEASPLDFEEDPDFVLNQPQYIKPKPDWRISFFSTTDINKVYTPFDVTFGNPAYTSIAGGYGGGITAAMKLNRIAFETGGLYSFKRYIPEPFSDQPFKPNSLFTQDFKGVQLDLLQIPINVQYHIKNRGKWRFYVNAGASIHMLLSPVYELERTWLAPPMPAPFEGDCDTCIENIKEFPKGILDGGSFKENAYGTLNAGFGIERFLNNRWSIFMQPTYQHYFTKKGVGPNDDKIYSVSFLLGTKVSLK